MPSPCKAVGARGCCLLLLLLLLLLTMPLPCLHCGNEQEAWQTELSTQVKMRPLQDAISHFDELLLHAKGGEGNPYKAILDRRHQIKRIGELEPAYLFNELSACRRLPRPRSVIASTD